MRIASLRQCFCCRTDGSTTTAARPPRRSAPRPTKRAGAEPDRQGLQLLSHLPHRLRPVPLSHLFHLSHSPFCAVGRQSFPGLVVVPTCVSSHPSTWRRERPCRRCIKIGKAHLCSDVPMRKRGRPRKTDPRYRPRDRKAAAASSSSTSCVAPPDNNSTDDRHRMTVAVHATDAGTGLCTHALVVYGTTDTRLSLYFCG